MNQKLTKKLTGAHKRALRDATGQLSRRDLHTFLVTVADDDDGQELASGGCPACAAEAGVVALNTILGVLVDNGDAELAAGIAEGAVDTLQAYLAPPA